MKLSNIKILKAQIRKVRDGAIADLVALEDIEAAARVVGDQIVEDAGGLASLAGRVSKLSDRANDVGFAFNSPDDLGGNLLPLLTVPDLSGLSVGDAAIAVSVAGFSFGVDQELRFSDTVVSGLIFGQSPPALSRAASDTVPSVIISKGPAS